MRSTFLGLEIGRRSIVAQQAALDVTGHNVANANTPGFTRQEAVMVTTRPYHAPALNQDGTPGQIGTGSEIKEIRRLRDSFVDLQIRDESQTLGYWQSMQTALDKVEVILNEPTDEGLRGVLDNFWKSWQALSESPENESVRAVVLERGMAVADTFHHMYQQLKDLRDDLNSQVKAKVEEINSLAQQLADLNKQIQAITIAGKEPNDLKDRRDLLLDQVSKAVDAKVVYERDGMVTVMVGGTPLVQGINHSSMGLNTDTQGLYKVVWDPTPGDHPGTSLTGKSAGDPAYTEVTLESGELLGMLEARGPAASSVLGSREALVPDLINRLNTLAKTIVIETNNVHQNGYSLNNSNGLNFFDQPPDVNDPSVEWASYIKVSDSIVDDVKNIAAATQPTLDAGGNPINFGDGGNALNIAQLKHALLIQQGTVDDYWRSQVSSVGVKAQEARRMVDNQETLVGQLESKRQSTSGVSLDEEMANMIRFQHAYNAAARYITTVDEYIDVIVNRMGIVGR